MSITVIHKKNEAFLGNKRHLDLSLNTSFSDLVFFVLSGKKPKVKESKLFKVILNLAIDHGPDTPSTMKTLKSAKVGDSISEAISKGILAIDDVHGGAGEGAMSLFYDLGERAEEKKKETIDHFLSAGNRVPGFGHRFYKTDPRAEKILSLVGSSIVGKKYVNIVKLVEKELFKKKKKRIPVNIDGAIAVVLCSFKWSPLLAKAVFIIARTPGLVAHYLSYNSKLVNKKVQNSDPLIK